MFGSANERFLKGQGKDVDAINALEPSKVRNFPYTRFSPPQGHSRCRGRVKRKVEPSPPAATSPALTPEVRRYKGRYKGKMTTIDDFFGPSARGFLLK